MRIAVVAAVAAALVGLSGCGGDGVGGGGGPTGPESGGAAALRGFGVEVDRAASARLPMVHVRTCGSWGCHDQDVPLAIAGPTSARPCPSGRDAGDSACSVVQLPGPGPGYGYAPVPALTLEHVTVEVTTPPGAPMIVRARVSVQPRAVCSGGASTCPDGTPQAKLRIAADGTVSQTR
jgi:hypothetical protein